jgi:hypothetical protein
MYGDLSSKYSGSNQNLHDEIKQLKKDIITKDEKYTNEILQLKKDIIINEEKNKLLNLLKDEKHMHEILQLKKDNENDMLKLELNFYKNK